MDYKKAYNDLVGIIEKIHGHPMMEARLRKIDHPSIDMDIFCDSHMIIDSKFFRDLRDKIEEQGRRDE